ncbi:hypothetical protein TNIN_173241 [Trichonephila inaurata madagascariensis]|uniref:Uncharacterized protein n=1 Tax=Trichonephila inaurata madagascariensis TaxID=2747483 RepID=A0A8X6XZI3_9ARAC|nr:hypothetical protein TNIN_173241 [Trichonephila inaurata madagascariensis]
MIDVQQPIISPSNSFFTDIYENHHEKPLSDDKRQFREERLQKFKWNHRYRISQRQSDPALLPKKKCQLDKLQRKEEEKTKKEKRRSHSYKLMTKKTEIRELSKNKKITIKTIKTERLVSIKFQA